jgi:hypothetical protein
MTSRFISRLALLVASLVWLAAVLMSVAWLSGLVSTGGTIADPDYLFRPLSISDGTRLVLGLAATVVAVGCGWLLHRSFKNGALPRAWRAVLIPAGAVAAYGGLTYDAATAPVIGANIGGGLMLLGVVPFVVAMVIVANAMVRRAQTAGVPDGPSTRDEGPRRRRQDRG